jgi:TPP-dependent pyruvate/acetoin dehydrogenase alpha subunit
VLLPLCGGDRYDTALPSGGVADSRFGAAAERAKMRTDVRVDVASDTELFSRLYRSAYRIRRVEQEIVRLYPSDKIKSPVHLSIGQESVSVGLCEALEPSDVVFGTYRGHALYLAKGGNLSRMMAELYGKVGGCARGKAGSMHLIDTDARMMGTSAIVATTIPQAVGYALVAKQRKANHIVVSVFGEGATDEGAYHESINFASLKKLPMLFLCENNQFAIYSHIRDRMPDDNLCERAEAYRVPAIRVEDGDTVATYREVKKAVAEIRAGSGPRFIEVMTYRWHDHVGPGFDRIYQYRPDSELDSWIARDQLKVLAAKVPDAERVRIEAAIETEIAEAIKFAEESPFPEGPELYTNVLHD